MKSKITQLIFVLSIVFLLTGCGSTSNLALYVPKGKNIEINDFSNNYSNKSSEASYVYDFKWFGGIPFGDIDMDASNRDFLYQKLQSKNNADILKNVKVSVDSFWFGPYIGVKSTIIADTYGKGN